MRQITKNRNEAKPIWASDDFNYILDHVFGEREKKARRKSRATQITCAIVLFLIILYIDKKKFKQQIS